MSQADLKGYVVNVKRSDVVAAVKDWARLVEKIPGDFDLSYAADDGYGGFIVTFVQPKRSVK